MKANKNFWVLIAIGIFLGIAFYGNFFNKDTKANEPLVASAQQTKEKEIDELTEENLVINFVKKHHKLPDYYITKEEAKAQGWIPSKGNLCTVLPGRAIGGNIFRNREKKLPLNNTYYEADVNYHCGTRQADRIIFTKNGEVWLTKNHYKSFELK